MSLMKNCLQNIDISLIIYDIVLLSTCGADIWKHQHFMKNIVGMLVTFRLPDPLHLRQLFLRVNQESEKEVTF